jgi:hypothetical protein
MWMVGWLVGWLEEDTQKENQNDMMMMKKWIIFCIASAQRFFSDYIVYGVVENVVCGYVIGILIFVVETK